jgi:hypothetical protein
MVKFYPPLQLKTMNHIDFFLKYFINEKKVKGNMKVKK